MSLYNAKKSNGGLRITKFTEDLDVESSYETTGNRCTCPAGRRPVCRHREMFDILAAKADTSWFYDYDSAEWYRFDSDAGQFRKGDPDRPAWRRI